MDQRIIFRVCLLLSCSVAQPTETTNSTEEYNLYREDYLDLNSTEMSMSSSGTPPGSTPSDLDTNNSLGSAGTMSPGHQPTTAIRKMTNPPNMVQPPVFSGPVTKDDKWFSKWEGSILLMVTGGLVVLCTILLVLCVMLACQVCHLKRRMPVSQGGGSRQVRSNVDLVSNSAMWGTAQRNKDAWPEGETSETSVLMKELDQTRKETVRISMDGEAEDREQTKEEGEKEKPKEVEKDENKANGDQGPAGGSKKEDSTQPAVPVVEPSTKAA